MALPTRRHRQICDGDGTKHGDSSARRERVGGISRGKNKSLYRKSPHFQSLVDVVEGEHFVSSFQFNLREWTRGYDETQFFTPDHFEKTTAIVTCIIFIRNWEMLSGSNGKWSHKCFLIVDHRRHNPRLRLHHCLHLHYLSKHRNCQSRKMSSCLP